MSEDRLIAERRAKIAEWERLGFVGYATKFDRSHTAAEAKDFCESNELRSGKEVMTDTNVRASLCGRIINLRDMGKMAFLKIRDVSGDFQICLSQNALGDQFKDFVKVLDMGDYAGFAGEFFLTKHGEPTLMASSVTPLSKALRSLPEKFHGLTDVEKCYRERGLDLATNPETFNRFQVRSKVVREIRRFYEDLDFVEVETPILQAKAGGAMAKTFQTHHNALDHEFHLRIALELPLKMICSGGFERVFEIGRCFRNEGTDPSHLQEFTMLEWYAAYCDIEQNKRWNEDMLRQICTNVLGTTKVTVLDKENDEHEIDFGQPFAEFTFAELLADHANLDMFKASDEEVKAKAKEVGVEHIDGVGRANLLDDIYKKTARPKLIQPTFVTNYPEDLKPLAAPNGDGTASCFQILVAGWEIVNAYGELINPDVQRALFEAQARFKAAGDDEAMEYDEEFVKAMEHGFPPMTGQGMGIDRLVALIMTQPNLRDVVLFPTMKPEGGEKAEGRSKNDTNLAVAIINTSLVKEDWQALNSVGHLCTAFGAREGKRLFDYDEIHTKDGKSIKLNTEQAIMIKQSTDNQSLIDLSQTAKATGIQVAEFTREMLESSDDEKVKAITKEKNLNDVEFFGVLVYGKKSIIEKMTKEFELLSEL